VTSESASRHIRQEPPLPQTAQRVRRAWLVYLIKFLRREFIDTRVIVIPDTEDRMIVSLFV